MKTAAATDLDPEGKAFELLSVAAALLCQRAAETAVGRRPRRDLRRQAREAAAAAREASILLDAAAILARRNS